MNEITLEQGAETGWAVKRNGTVLIRTATETPVQAKGNGLVLIFDARPDIVDWSSPENITNCWDACDRQSADQLEIVPCRVVEVPGA